MLAIGSIQTIEERGYVQHRGEIHTLDLDLDFWLETNSASSSDAAPAFTIFAKSRSGRTVRIGSAWKKTIKTARRAGEEFLSLTFDDPSFPAPLNVAAFKTDRQGAWDITWRRRQDRLPADAADRGAT